MRTIVIVLRGCPAGWLGAYGNEWVGTPNLDRLAAEGVTFDRHLSDCPAAAAAGRAWMSGRHGLPPLPPAPEAGGEGGPDVLLPALRAAGVRTAVIRANHSDTDAAAPFYDGWDEVFDARPGPADDSPLAALIAALPSHLDRLAAVPRWLLWVETDRLLPPWDVRQDVFEAYLGNEDDPDPADADPSSADPDEEDGPPAEAAEVRADDPAGAEDGGGPPLPPSVANSASPADPDEPVTPFADPPTGPFDRADAAAGDWLHRTFAAVVTSLDAELGAVIDLLRDRGLDRTATWVLTGDYGHPLGEHGQVGPHRPWLHEEFVHVPLVVRLPGAAEAGRRVPGFTQPADLAPTLLDGFGAGLPAAPLHGHSLLPLARGEVDAVRPYAVSGLAVGGAAEWAIRTAGWAYLLPADPPDGDPPRPPQLFEKPDDRCEVNDLRRQHPELVDRLDAALRGAVAAARRPGPLVLPGVDDEPAAG